MDPYVWMHRMYVCHLCIHNSREVRDGMHQKLCMHRCMFVCMYIKNSACIDVSLHACVYIDAYMHACMSAYVSVYDIWTYGCMMYDIRTCQSYKRHVNYT